MRTLAINIHDPLFLEAVPAEGHGALSYAYNAAWREFITRNPQATWDQVCTFARALMLEKFGVPAPF